MSFPFPMPHPEHDKIVDAFVRAGGVAPCNRGDPTKGYTHVHGPSCPAQPAHCTNHVVVVEKQNGTVGLRDPIGMGMQALQRPPQQIDLHPLGYSYRADYGAFSEGILAADILRRWGTYDAFAQDVVTRARHLGYW